MIVRTSLTSAHQCACKEELTMTIGTNIGIVQHTLSITNDRDEKAQITIKVDFSTATDNDIKSWLVSNRVIAGQRPWRKLSLVELKELNGQTFIAQDIGKKVKSRQEQIDQFKTAFVSAGIPLDKALELAMAAVDNPQLLNVKAENNEEVEETEE